MIGNKKKVFHGYAVMTKNGLTINDLTLNSRGKIVQKGGLLDLEDRSLMEQALADQVAADTETLGDKARTEIPAERTLDPPLEENAWFNLESLDLRRKYHQAKAKWEAVEEVISILGFVSVPNPLRHYWEKESDRLRKEILITEYGQGKFKNLPEEDKIKLGLPDASKHPPQEEDKEGK